MLRHLQLLMFNEQALLERLDFFAVFLECSVKRGHLFRLQLPFDMFDHAGGIDHLPICFIMGSMSRAAHVPHPPIPILPSMAATVVE